MNIMLNIIEYCLNENHSILNTKNVSSLILDRRSPQHGQHLMLNKNSHHNMASIQKEENEKKKILESEVHGHKSN